MNDSQIIVRGYVFFLAWFLGGLFVLYDESPLISTQPFIAKFFLNSPWTYFEFVNFWFWFVIIPLTFWWYCIRPLQTNSPTKRAFHRG
jgi:hypothetical protein